MTQPVGKSAIKDMAIPDDGAKQGGKTHSKVAVRQPGQSLEYELI